MQEHTEELTLNLLLDNPAVPLSFYNSTSEDLRQILVSVERERLGGSSHAEWIVSVDEIQISAQVNGVSATQLQDIIGDVYRGIQSIQEGLTPPPTLNEAARAKLRTLLNRFYRTTGATVFAIGQEPIAIEPHPSPNIGLGRPNRYAAWASLDGRLDVISVRRNPYFVIYEHASTVRVRCSFPDDWMELVKNYLGFRVIAEGYVRYRLDGAPLSLTSPTALERVPDPQYPDITSLRGTMPGITGGLSSYEYVRQLREDVDFG